MRASWNPFRELDALRREVDRLFSDFGRGSDPFRVAFLPGRTARGYPLLNVSEEAERLVVEAVAPGLDPDTINVSLKGRALVLSGEKKPLPEIPREAYHRSERAAGRFVRTIQLDADIDAAHVEADYQDGILTILLPKSEQARPRQVEVKVR